MYISYTRENFFNISVLCPVLRSLILSQTYQLLTSKDEVCDEK